jgi:hypothetical protein
VEHSRPARVGYDSAYHAPTGTYRYSFWDLGGCVTLESPHRFLRGDPVKVESVDPDRHVVAVSPAFVDPESVGDSLLFLSPKVPLAHGSRHEVRADRLSVVHVREVSLRGNKSFVALVIAPNSGRSSLTFVEEGNRNRFHFFLTGQDEVRS